MLRGSCGADRDSETRKDGDRFSVFPGFRPSMSQDSMNKDDCLLIGGNDHVITVGFRTLYFVG